MLKNINFNKHLFFRIFVIMAFILLCLNYMTNIFHIVNSDWFSTWQNDSDSIIIGRAYVMKHFGLAYNYFLLPLSDGFATGIFDITTLTTYTSQFGLGGNILGLFLNLPYGLTICHLILCSLFCGVIFYITKWIYEEFGIIPAMGAYFAAFFSRWLIVSVRDLYWLVFIFILPFVISLYFLKKEEIIGKSNLIIWSVINFCVIVFKSLSGFEGITVILINSVLPIFYYALKNKWRWQKLLSTLFIIGMSGLFAFFFAVFCHILQLYFYFNHNWHEAFTLFNNDIARRTAATTFQGQLPDTYQESLKTSKFDVLKLYLTWGKRLIIGLRMYAVLIIYAVAVLISILHNQICSLKNNKLYPFILLTTLSLLGPISWHVLASPHSFIHTHINYMYWSLPALILIFAFLFYILNLLVNIFIKGNKL